MRHSSSSVCMAGITCVYVDTIFAFFPYQSLLLSWMFEHDCLDTCCFGCLICMCFVFLCLHLLSATDHVSHGKALCKYALSYFTIIIIIIIIIISKAQQDKALIGKEVGSKPPTQHCRIFGALHHGWFATGSDVGHDVTVLQDRLSSGAVDAKVPSHDWIEGVKGQADPSSVIAHLPTQHAGFSVSEAISADGEAIVVKGQRHVVVQ